MTIYTIRHKSTEREENFMLKKFISGVLACLLTLCINPIARAENEVKNTAKVPNS